MSRDGEAECGSDTFIVVSEGSFARITRRPHRRVWDVESGQQTLSLRGPHNCVRGVSFSSDGKRLAAVSHDRTLTLWETIPLGERLSLGKSNLPK